MVNEQETTGGQKAAPVVPQSARALPRASPPSSPAVPRLAGVELNELIGREASGQFIAAAGGVEVHLFLQRGRLAWGHASDRRDVFRGFLQAECRMTAAELGEIIETCRRERTSLREALVRLKVATPEQVRSALREQIASAVAALGELSSAPAVFLPRDAAGREQDSRFTFSLDEVATAPPPAPERASQASLGAAQQLATEVRGLLPQLDWVAVLDRAEVGFEDPRGSAGEVLALHQATLAEGASFVLSRDARSTVIGTRRGDEGLSVWGGFGAGVLLSEALAVFPPFSVRCAPGSERDVPAGEPNRRGPPHGTFDAVARTLLRERMVWGALLQRHDGALGPSVVRAGASLDRITPSLAARAAVLQRRSAGPTSGAPLLAVADPGGWWFGVAVPEGTAWLLTSASLRLGLGLALQRSLAGALGATAST